MNYYSHHIGDYLSATAHLTLLEHGVYRRLIDVYYINESPLPADRKQVYRLVGARTEEEREAVDCILEEFFTETESGWAQSRCDHEIILCNKNRENGRKGGRPSKSKNPNETQQKPTKNPNDNPNDNPNETQQESPPSPHHPITPSPYQTPPLTPPDGGKEIGSEKSKSKTSAIAFKTFIENCKANSESPIDRYAPVFDYAEKIGLPHDFLVLCWNEFFRRHSPGGVNETKRHKDWRQTFRNCLEGNWYKLWWEGQNGFELTTAGRTAMKAAA